MVQIVLLLALAACTQKKCSIVSMYEVFACMAKSYAILLAARSFIGVGTDACHGFSSNRITVFLSMAPSGGSCDFGRIRVILT